MTPGAKLVLGGGLLMLLCGLVDVVIAEMARLRRKQLWRKR
jgi:hypothetical protein